MGALPASEGAEGKARTEGPRAAMGVDTKGRENPSWVSHGRG